MKSNSTYVGEVKVNCSKSKAFALAAPLSRGKPRKVPWGALYDAVVVAEVSRIPGLKNWVAATVWPAVAVAVALVGLPLGPNEAVEVVVTDVVVARAWLALSVSPAVATLRNPTVRVTPTFVFTPPLPLMMMTSPWLGDTIPATRATATIAAQNRKCFTDHPMRRDDLTAI